MTCAILLSHDLLLQAGLGADEKAPQLGLGGHWRLESPLAIQVQVNGHCRRFHRVSPLSARVGTGAQVATLAIPCTSAWSLGPRASAEGLRCAGTCFAPQDRLGEQSGCSERLLRFLECWRSFLFLSCCPLLGCVTVGSTQKIAIRAC